MPSINKSSTKSAENTDDVLGLLNPALSQYFIKDLKHKQLTQVQKCTIQKMLANFDCIVQAPTGSGKTLAFLLPTLQIVEAKRQKPENPSDCQILAMVVAPSRELVNQVHSLFQPICKRLGLNTIRLFGSGSQGKKRTKIGIQHFKGQCILIATPGRIESFVEKEPQLKSFLKHLEVLVIDEADRYSDQESRKSLTTLLSILPKQRRTALFSATQATAIEDLLKFGLRNPLRLTVAADNRVHCREETFNGHTLSNEATANGDESGDFVTPKELVNYYACVPAQFKLLALLKFLKSQKEAKVLAFVSNAAQSEYFSLVVPPLLGDEKRVVLSLHRKMEGKRQKILNQFRTTARAILFSTDLMARGIDVLDIDWVLQFDTPKLCQLFVHRIGRCGRMGRQGRSLLILTEEESAFVEFIENHEKVELKECEFGRLTSEKAEQVRAKVQEMAISDRKILELGSTAFISYIAACTRSDHQIVCKVKDLNISGLANAYGLLRMPRIKELDGRRDLRQFQPREDVRTSQIPFKSAKHEQKRQQQLADRKSGKIHKIEPNEVEDGEEEREVRKPGKKRRNLSEWEQLQRDGQLLKKFKRGKLSKEQLEQEMEEF